MPQYSKTAWVDGLTPAINATNLNKLEQGIFDSIRQDGSTTMSAQFVTIAGTAATPAIAPTGDSNTGIFFPAADTIAFGEGGTEVMRITSAGSVGIGTTSPQNKLEVSTSTGGVVGIATSGATAGDMYGRLAFYSTASSNAYINYGGEIRSYIGAGINESDLRFYTSDSLATSSERLRISKTGNVGIGTTSPGDKLHVVGNIYLGTANQTIYTAGTGNLTLQTGTGNIIFARNNAADTTMFLNNSGNVGIGTNSPTSVANITTLCVNNTSGSNLEMFVNGTRTGILTSSSTTVSLRNLTTNPLLFFTDSVERFQVESGGRVRPSANNTYELGSSTFRWSTIYAQNALNTSDARLKTDVTESSLGLEFISALNPVQFRYIEGGNTVERVQTGTETVELSPSIPAQPEVLDQDGNVIQEATEEVIAVTEEQPVYEEVVTPREGIRTHFGLIAQEVKAALPDGLDFGGWALADKDDADSTQFLGYMELIAPMIKAIQELKAEVDALKSQINKQ